MRKVPELLAMASAISYTASIATVVEKQYLLATILAPLSGLFVIIAIFVQRIYIKQALMEEEQS